MPAEGFKGQGMLPLPAAPAERPRQGRGDAPPNFVSNPVALAAARMESARNEKFDRSKYETVRSRQQLDTWIARAGEAGMIAIGVMTASHDPMQAELCGFSLAVAPNAACYVPLAHRQGGEGSDLFQGGLAPDQIGAASALNALKPLLTDAGVLKLGHNLKFDRQIFARHGIEIEPYDDTMLMSYALDAGRASHGLEFAGRAQFWSRRARPQRTDQGGQEQDQLRRGRHRPGGGIRGREGRRGSAAVPRAESAACRRACADRLRDAGAAARRRAGADGAARHCHRPRCALAAFRRVRAGSRRPRSRDQRTCRRAGQSG